jgi:hypothetical protein
LHTVKKLINTAYNYVDHQRDDHNSIKKIERKAETKKTILVIYPHIQPGEARGNYLIGNYGQTISTGQLLNSGKLPPPEKTNMHQGKMDEQAKQKGRKCSNYKGGDGKKIFLAKCEVVIKNNQWWIGNKKNFSVPGRMMIVQPR